MVRVCAGSDPQTPEALLPTDTPPVMLPVDMAFSWLSNNIQLIEACGAPLPDAAGTLMLFNSAVFSALPLVVRSVTAVEVADPSLEAKAPAGLAKELTRSEERR